jgi:hypothetical protein
MAPRHVLAAFAAVVASFVGPGAVRSAYAWQEAHQTGDDVDVRLDPAGSAQVAHRVRWHVVRGPLRSIDLVNVDASAAIEPDVTIATDDGKTLTAHAVRRDERTVRVSIDEPRAVMRGNFVFDVRWRVDMVASHALVRDGATWRLTWSAPVATDGFDAAKSVFELPAAPETPVAIVADTGAVDDAVVSALRREPGTDVLELVRPHVARGEAPVWTLRVDPRALPLVADPALRPPSEAPLAEPDRVREVLTCAGILSLAIVFGALVKGRAAAAARVAARRGEKVRALLPLSPALRAALAGGSLAGAVALELAGEPTIGAICVAAAVMAAALRAPKGPIPARGPGRWLLLQPRDAFVREPGWRAGDVIACLAVVAALVAAAAVAERFDAEGPWLVALDALALVPLALTGRASQSRPDGARGAASWLARLYRRLAGVKALRVSPWARVPVDSSRPDELRLLVMPRAAMPGVVGVEVGLAWSQTPVGWAMVPEVLARFLEGSAAAARITRELPSARTVPGRRPEERVVRLAPRTPSQRDAAALVRSLADAFTDRRISCDAATWSAVERRVPLPANVVLAGANEIARANETAATPLAAAAG